MPFTETQKSQFIALLQTKGWQLLSLLCVFAPFCGQFTAAVCHSKPSPASRLLQFEPRSSRPLRENLRAHAAGSSVAKSGLIRFLIS
jgi:hypothetical protein